MGGSPAAGAAAADAGPPLSLHLREQNAAEKDSNSASVEDDIRGDGLLVYCILMRIHFDDYLLFLQAISLWK
jgi:hypothetical protein